MKSPQRETNFRRGEKFREYFQRKQAHPSLFVLAVLLLGIALTDCYSFNDVNLSPFQKRSGRLQRKVLLSEAGPGTCIGGRPDSGKFLLIPIQGVISSDSSPGDKGTSPAKIKKLLEYARYEFGWKGILLKVNSPGGTVTDSDIIYRLIKKFAEKRKLPVYAHFENIGASGAYYVAMSARKLNVTPTGLVGSIGVIIRGFNFKGLLEKYGIKERSIFSGKNKNASSPFRDLSPEYRRHLQEQVDASRERFLTIVLSSRGKRIKEQELRALADGRVYMSKKSVQSGLVDSRQYLEDFLETIKKEMGIHRLTVISFLPQEKFHASIYDVQESRFADWRVALLRYLKISASGPLYLWDGGF